MYKIGLFERDITPPFGCFIPGYFNLRLGSGVKDKLFCKAVAISKDDSIAILIAVDACSISIESTKEICARVTKYTGIPENNILVSVNHTHTGGPVKFDNGLKGGDKDLDTMYVKNMRTTVADCAITAYQKMEPANMKYVKGNVEGISYIRNYVMKDGSLRTNPGRLNPDIVKPYGENDTDLEIMLIEDANGKPKGSICSFACHQDCVDGTEYSGDYSSALAKELKKQYGNEFINLFFVGTCGNINHFNVTVKEDKPDHYVMMGKKIFEEYKAIIGKAKSVEGSVEALKEEIRFIRRMPSDEVIAEAENDVATIVVPEGIKLAADSPKAYFQFMMSENLLKFVNNEKYYIKVPVQVIKLGSVMFYGMPGEVFVTFGRMIKQNSPLKDVIIATLCNANSGYVPTEDCFLPGLYESLYGSAYIPEGGGKIFTEKLIEMARKISK